LYADKCALSTIEETSSVSIPAQQKSYIVTKPFKKSIPPSKASHKSSKKASSLNTAKKTATNPDDSDDSEDDTLLVELSRWKESSKKASSYQADLNSCDHEPVTKKKQKGKKSDYVSTKSVVLSSIDLSTLFDLINPTFAGFDPKTTWSCSNEGDIIVKYVNGNGGLDGRIPITDFDMASIMFVYALSHILSLMLFLFVQMLIQTS